jgi:hypothetical protein
MGTFLYVETIYWNKGLKPLVLTMLNTAIHGREAIALLNKKAID